MAKSLKYTLSQLVWLKHEITWTDEDYDNFVLLVETEARCYPDDSDRVALAQFLSQYSWQDFLTYLAGKGSDMPMFQYSDGGHVSLKELVFEALFSDAKSSPVVDRDDKDHIQDWHIEEDQ